MTHGKLDDAHASEFHGKAKKPEYPESDIMVAADLRQTEARDGPEGGAVALNNSKHIELPDNVTRSISGDRPRTVCLWARIDKWKNKARIFEYGRKAPQGELFGLRTWNVPGALTVELPWNVRNHWDNRHVVLSTNVSMVPAPTPSPTTPEPTPFVRRRLDGTDTDSDSGSNHNSGEEFCEQSGFTETECLSYDSAACKCNWDSDQGQCFWGEGSCVPTSWVNTWHHYCVTYAAEEHPKEKDRYLPGNVTLYVDGRKEGFWKNATVNTSLGSPLYIGADIHGSKTLDGAVDEVYVYDKALEAWQVEVLHGILSPPPTAAPSAVPTPVPTPLPSLSPTLTSAPTAHEYQDNLVAYYPMTHGKLDDAHTKFHGKAWRPEQPDVPDSMMVAADLRQTDARDGPEGAAVALNNSKYEYIELPDNVTRSISGDRPRTVCLWARIDKWKNARIFEYGRKAPQGELFGLRTWNVPGEFAVEVPWNVRNHWDNRNVNLSTNVSITQAPTPSPTTPQPTLEPGMSRRLDATGETTAAPTPQSPWVKTWHHYCVTYAAEPHPKEKDRYLPGNVTLYVDGRKEGFWKNATVNTSLGSKLYIGSNLSLIHI